MKVLIVDDDILLCSALARDLIRRGHASRAATTVDAALALVETETLAALLTDLDLGAGGSGVELIARVRATGRKLPAILMTGSDPLLARAQLVAAGLEGLAILQKPFTADELMQALGELLHDGGGPNAGRPRSMSMAARLDGMISSVARSLGGRIV